MTSRYFGVSIFQFFIDSLLWLKAWWFLVLLIEFRSQFSAFASSYYQFTSQALDEKYPDDLDQTASEWVKGRIEHLNHDVKVSKVAEVVFRSLNAYLPSDRIIFLGDKTWSKNDPTFWAIAAHELGHAFVYQSHPIWAAVNLVARRVFKWISNFIPTLLLVNTFYRDPVATTIIYSLLSFGIFAGVLVLIDEAWASKLAMSDMESDDRVEDSWLPDIKLGLRSAFLTYAAVFVGLVVLCASYPFMGPMLSTGFEVQPLTSSEISTVDILACLIGFLTVGLWSERRVIYDLVSKKSAEDFELAGCGKAIAVVFGVVLVSCLLYPMLLIIWNSHASPLFIAIVFLASLAAHSAYRLHFLPLFLFIGFPLLRIRNRLWPPPPKDIKTLEEEKHDEKKWNQWLAENPEASKSELEDTNPIDVALNEDWQPNSIDEDTDRTAVVPHWNWMSEVRPGLTFWVLPIITYWIYIRLFV